MKIAALVLGALAGIVASLILALGGMEITAATLGGLGDRQIAGARFTLILIPNIVLLGAGLSLAYPRIAAIPLLLATLLWAVGAIVLGHRADLVLAVPTALMLIAAIVAFLAGMFAARRASSAAAFDEARLALAERDEPRAVDAEYEGEEADPSGVSVRYVQPVSVSANGNTPRMQMDDDDQLGGLEGRSAIPGRLTGDAPPQARPSRQSRPIDPSFINPEDETEDSPWINLGRGVASVLNFALYAALAAGVLLATYNLAQRDGATTNVAALPPAETKAAPPATAAKVEALPAPAKVTPKAETAAPTTLPADTTAPVENPDRLASPPGLPLATDAAEPASESKPAVRTIEQPPPPETDQVVTISPRTGMPTLGEDPNEPPPDTEIAASDDTAAAPAGEIGEAPAPALMSPDVAAARKGPAVGGIATEAPAPRNSDI